MKKQTFVNKHTGQQYTKLVPENDTQFPFNPCICDDGDDDDDCENDDDDDDDYCDCWGENYDEDDWDNDDDL